MYVNAFDDAVRNTESFRQSEAVTGSDTIFQPFIMLQDTSIVVGIIFTVAYAVSLSVVSDTDFAISRTVSIVPTVSAWGIVTRIEIFDVWPEVIENSESVGAIVHPSLSHA